MVSELNSTPCYADPCKVTILKSEACRNQCRASMDSKVLSSHMKSMPQTICFHRVSIDNYKV